MRLTSINLFTGLEEVGAEEEPLDPDKLRILVRDTKGEILDATGPEEADTSGDADVLDFK